jgi:hypothetical protein
VKLVLAAVVALVIAAPALAASEAPSLEPAASWVAGKPVKVFCSQEHAGAGWTGWTIPGSSSVYVDDGVCVVLLSRLARTDDVTVYTLAESLETLAHEAMHASGLADESATDCAALKRLPGMVSRFFHFSTWRSRHDLMYAAWQVHVGLPPEYRTRC